MSRAGKIYRVNAYAVSDECSACWENRGIVRSKGWLWTYEGARQGSNPDYRSYRSVATGERAPWADNELEELE